MLVVVRVVSGLQGIVIGCLEAFIRRPDIQAKLTGVSIHDRQLLPHLGPVQKTLNAIGQSEDFVGIPLGHVVTWRVDEPAQAQGVEVGVVT